MKTPLPEPQFSFEGDWYSEAQLRAAMVAAYEEGIEEAAQKVRSLISNKNPLELVMNGVAKEILTLKETP